MTMNWLRLSLSLLSLCSVSDAGTYGTDIVRVIDTDVRGRQDVPDRLVLPEVDAANLQAFFENPDAAQTFFSMPLSLQVEQERGPEPRRFIRVPGAEDLPRLSATIAYPVLSDTFAPEALNRCLYRVASEVINGQVRYPIRHYATFTCKNDITVYLVPREAAYLQVQADFKLPTVYRDDLHAILHATIQWAAIVNKYGAWSSADRERHVSPYRSMRLEVLRDGDIIGEISIVKTKSDPHNLAPRKEALCARCPRKGRSLENNQAAAPSRPRQGSKRTRPKGSSESDPDALSSLEEQSARDSPEKASGSSHEPSSSRTQTNGLGNANALSPEDADLLIWLDHGTGANGQIWK